MSTTYTLTSSGDTNSFLDTLAKGDVKQYAIDATAWLPDGETVVSADWSIEHGNASISNEELDGSVTSATVTATGRGKVLISVLVTTTNFKKKLWLELAVQDKRYYGDDYGQGCSC